MQLGFMEDGDNISNLSDGDHNRILQWRSNISIMNKESIWYDIQHLPDSLLIEILARLPVKSIFRFKSVCKHWQTLISHPSFSRFYISIFNSSAAASSPFRILYKYTYLPNFKEFGNRLAPEIHSSSEFPLLFLSSREEQHPNDQFKVINMSNGLILCRSRSRSLRTETGYYIYDPLTRKWITIPRRGPQPHLFSVEGFITRVNEDHMLTGYTLVWAQNFETRSNYLNLDIFSSETGEWIGYRIPCAIPIRLRESCNCPILCYGALHWPAVRYHDRIHGLVAFDPYKDPKSVRLIPLPEDRDLQCEYQDGGCCQLYGECQGTLRYMQGPCNPTKLYLLIMWAMKDYEKGEWCCEFKVRRSDVHCTNLELSNWLVDGGWFLPISLHPLNPNVVYLKCMGECIVSYDVLNRRLDVASEPIDVSPSISWLSAIPCVLPRWPLLV